MLVAIDAQKLFELTQEGHQIWTFQLVLVMATSLFLYELGPVILWGMASMVLFLAAVKTIVSRVMQYYKLRIAETDRRVNSLMSLLIYINI